MNDKMNLEQDARSFASELAASITHRWGLQEQNIIISQLCQELVKHRQNLIDDLELQRQQVSIQTNELYSSMSNQFSIGL